MIGVLKAYCTRVGSGPFPTEMPDLEAQEVRERGNEFGAVTGRPRRCGWLDAVAARYAVALNGLTSAVITKLDVLSGFDRIGIVTEYRAGGRRVGFGSVGLDDVEPVVEQLPGWSEPVGECRQIADLPKAARAYVDRVRELLAVPIELVSVGRERTQLAR